MPNLQSQGLFITKTSDRFKAGRPDMRMGRLDLGQMDVELKFRSEPEDKLKAEMETGLSKLQWIKIGEMNKHGLPAIGLVYLQVLDVYVVTTKRLDILCDPSRYVKSGPSYGNLDAVELFDVAKKHLKEIYG